MKYVAPTEYNLGLLKENIILCVKLYICLSGIISSSSAYLRSAILAQYCL